MQEESLESAVPFLVWLYFWSGSEQRASPWVQLHLVSRDRPWCSWNQLNFASRWWRGTVSYLPLLRGLDLHPASPLLSFTAGKARENSVQPGGKCFPELCISMANGMPAAENLSHKEMMNISDGDRGSAGIALSCAILSVSYLNCSTWGCPGSCCWGGVELRPCLRAEFERLYGLCPVRN